MCTLYYCHPLSLLFMSILGEGGFMSHDDRDVETVTSHKVNQFEFFTPKTEDGGFRGLSTTMLPAFDDDFTNFVHLSSTPMPTLPPSSRPVFETRAPTAFNPESPTSKPAFKVPPTRPAFKAESVSPLSTNQVFKTDAPSTRPVFNTESPTLRPAFNSAAPSLRPAFSESPQTTFEFAPTPMTTDNIHIFSFQPTPPTTSAKKLRFRPTTATKHRKFEFPPEVLEETENEIHDFTPQFFVDPGMKEKFAIVKVKNHKFQEEDRALGVAQVLRSR